MSKGNKRQLSCQTWGDLNYIPLIKQLFQNWKSKCRKKNENAKITLKYFNPPSSSLLKLQPPLPLHFIASQPDAMLLVCYPSQTTPHRILAKTHTNHQGQSSWSPPALCVWHDHAKCSQSCPRSSAKWNLGSGKISPRTIWNSPHYLLRCSGQ